MSETVRQTPPNSGSGGRKAMLGTGLVVGVALDSSQSSPPTPPVAVANSQQDKKATAATPRAVDATTAFLEALDAKQRG